MFEYLFLSRIWEQEGMDWLTDSAVLSFFLYTLTLEDNLI